MERDKRGGETVRLGEKDVIFGEDVWPGEHIVLVACLESPLECLDGFYDLT